LIRSASHCLAAKCTRLASFLSGFLANRTSHIAQRKRAPGFAGGFEKRKTQDLRGRSSGSEVDVWTGSSPAWFTKVNSRPAQAGCRGTLTTNAPVVAPSRSAEGSLMSPGTTLRGPTSRSSRDGAR